MKNVCVVGGAGFIGSHIVQRLRSLDIEVTVYDLQNNLDAHDIVALICALHGCDTVIHLASNADIAAASENPVIDFTEGTVITQNVVEAARLAGVRTIIYASGSGVYGDRVQDYPFAESDPLEPNSPYGASKLAGEALVSAYCHMFNMRGLAFRFANVVGPGQTHGVGYDFINALKADKTRLRILGDGNQSKSYIAIPDVIDAVLLAEKKSKRTFDVYNVATQDALTVTEIAKMASEVMHAVPRLVFNGGSRGWPGDVPVVRLKTSRIRWLGWKNAMTSREAMQWALEAMACA